MNCYEGGYVDQLRGACKEAMLVGEGRDASAYRAGARTCRADLAAESDGDNIGEWARRLAEFRGMAGLGPILAKSVTQPVISTGQVVSAPIVTTPNAFADPVPGAKKAKKPKPVDADQGSLFG